VFSEVSEYFSDIVIMLFWVSRVNQYVIQVDDNANVKQVGKDFIHVALECGWGVAKAKVHN